MTIVEARSSHAPRRCLSFPSVDGFHGLGQGRVLNFPSGDGVFVVWVWVWGWGWGRAEDGRGAGAVT